MALVANTGNDLSREHDRRRLTGERQRTLADALGKVARSLRQAKKPDGGKASGTKVARNRKQAS